MNTATLWPRTGCVPGLLLRALGRLAISFLDHTGVCFGTEAFILWSRAQYVGRTLGKRHKPGCMGEVLAGQATCKMNMGPLFRNYHAFQHGHSRALITREASWAGLRSPTSMPLASVLTHLQKLGGTSINGVSSCGKNTASGTSGHRTPQDKGRVGSRSKISSLS